MRVAGMDHTPNRLNITGASDLRTNIVRAIGFRHQVSPHEQVSLLVESAMQPASFATNEIACTSVTTDASPDCIRRMI